MLFVLSPAKTLDFSPTPVTEATEPRFLDAAAELIAALRPLSPSEIAGLMSLSDALAVLNVTRYGEWARAHGPEVAKQAVLAFNGDVYEGLDAASLDGESLAWAQQHLRILSGLYGVLRPLDRIRPYRLEMGTRLATPRGKDLYAFWGDTPSDALAMELAGPHGGGVLVNLASEEYFKAVRRKKVGGRIIDCVFEDCKGDGATPGKYKIVSFYAKRARGLMARYLIEGRVDRPEGLLDFNSEGYAYAPEVSSPDKLVFRRRHTD